MAKSIAKLVLAKSAGAFSARLGPVDTKTQTTNNKLRLQGQCRTRAVSGKCRRDTHKRRRSLPGPAARQQDHMSSAGTQQVPFGSYAAAEAPCERRTALSRRPAAAHRARTAARAPATRPAATYMPTRPRGGYIVRFSTLTVGNAPAPDALEF